MSAPINLVTLSGWVAKKPTTVGENRQQYSFQLVQHPYQPLFHRALESFEDCLIATVLSADDYAKEVLKQGDHVVVSGKLLPQGNLSKNVTHTAPLVIWGVSIQRSEFLERIQYTNRNFHNGFEPRFVSSGLLEQLELTEIKRGEKNDC